MLIAVSRHEQENIEFKQNQGYTVRPDSLKNEQTNTPLYVGCKFS
jgi:hypothetical protein